jgi:hypothetical protein
MQDRGIDIAVHRPSGELIAGVEIKNRLDLDPSAADSFRRMLIARKLLANAPFFLLLSQDRGYVWTPSTASVPTAEFSMTEVLSRYAPWLPTGERLRGQELESLVLSWLADLAAGIIDPDSTPAARILMQLGFVGAVRGASLSRERAA